MHASIAHDVRLIGRPCPQRSGPSFGELLSRLGERHFHPADHPAPAGKFLGRSGLTDHPTIAISAFKGRIYKDFSDYSLTGAR